jgi:hypothetical protein
VGIVANRDKRPSQAKQLVSKGRLRSVCAAEVTESESIRVCWSVYKTLLIAIGIEFFFLVPLKVTVALAKAYNLILRVPCYACCKVSSVNGLLRVGEYALCVIVVHIML